MRMFEEIQLKKSYKKEKISCQCKIEPANGGGCGWGAVGRQL